MNKVAYETTRKVGNLGEDIACRYLESRDFLIIERNYWKKWGEIDVIARKGEMTHFVEVKSVSREKSSERLSEEGSFYRPEENVHPKKLKRLRRVVQTYVLEKGIEDGKWQFDVLSILLDTGKKTARCRLLEDVVL